MLELIAQGSNPDSRWRRSLPEFPVELGRATESYRVPWDQQISRRHIEMRSGEHRLTVRRLPSAANPVFFNGQEASEFVVLPGEHFVIGGTTFLLTEDQAFGSLEIPDPISQQTFSSDFLEQVSYRDADRRIAVLNRMPQVIANADDSQELLIGMVNLLMSGIATATTIGIVRWNLETDSPASSAGRENQEGDSAAGPPRHSQPSALTASPMDTVTNEELRQLQTALRVIHWDRRGLDRGDFQASETLVAQSVSTQESVLNVWHPQATSEQGMENYTFDYEHDWAFACPIEGPATHHWAIYVAGKNRGASVAPDSDDKAPLELDLDGDIKFCELVGSTLKHLLQVKRLERQQASLRTFFSPVVVDALRGRDPEQVLAPRACDLSVLFCDLRGFAQTSERWSHDLLGLLERVSDSLELMTGAILDHAGVIGDFHGDAVMGFWGWPLESKSPQACAVDAARTACAIESLFSGHFQDHPRLQNFHVGLGIASGQAVAGKIGTRDQVKVTAFGPVVNLAARLEGMTRQLHSTILVDEPTAQHLLQFATSPGTQGEPTPRRLGRFLPVGLTQPVQVYQIHRSGQRDKSNDQRYQIALKAFEQGDWLSARRNLEQMSTEDSARGFLLAELAKVEDVRGDFDGIIKMSTKR